MHPANIETLMLYGATQIMGIVMRRYFATTRQVTGDPMRHIAYVMDRQTGKVVCTCKHRHVSRLRYGGKNGEYYAKQCADKMLRKFMAK